MSSLIDLLKASAALHRHLCPRQVLGVRMGLFAGELLGLEVPQAPSSKRLLAIVETDGCAADGIAVATNCWVGRRTMRLEDYGKVTATFVDTHTEQALRLVPRPEARERAGAWATEANNKWEAQLLGYQRLPASDLFAIQRVQLKTPIEKIVSQAGRKTRCEICGEEVLNEREVVQAGNVLCRACAGHAYYRLLAEAPWDLSVRRQPVGLER